jgi:HD-like signal output (HDOD) protein
MALKPPPKKGPGGPATGGPANPLKPPTVVAPNAVVRPGTVKPAAPLSQPGFGKPPPPGARKPGSPAPGIAVGSGRVNLSKAGAKSGGHLFRQMRADMKPADEPEENVEETVAKLPGLTLVRESAMFKDFIEKVAPVFSLGNTSFGILSSFSNIDVTSQKVAACLKANPYYEYQFYKMIEAVGRRTEFPSLEAAVILLGMQNSRNLILSLQARRAALGGHPEWTKDIKLRYPPSEVVKYAIRAEEMLDNTKSVYADTAYAAGLLFDILVLLAERGGDEKRTTLQYIDSLYSHGLRTALLGSELAKHIPEFSFSKYVFAVCLMHDIGKGIMAVLNPEYSKFALDCQKRGIPRVVRHFAEEKRFGVNHATIGGIACHYFKVFRPIERAIFHHHTPYVLQRQNKGLYQLCSIICMATNMANNFKKIDKADDPMIALWKGQELKDFPFETRAMIAAVKKINI